MLSIKQPEIARVCLTHSFTLDKWKAFMEIKEYFDIKCGLDIYSVLPNVMENSYKNLLK